MSVEQYLTVVEIRSIAERVGIRLGKGQVVSAIHKGSIVGARQVPFESPTGKFLFRWECPVSSVKKWLFEAGGPEGDRRREILSTVWSLDRWMKKRR